MMGFAALNPSYEQTNEGPMRNIKGRRRPNSGPIQKADSRQAVVARHASS